MEINGGYKSNLIHDMKRYKRRNLFNGLMTRDVKQALIF